jgi:cytochrome P450
LCDWQRRREAIGAHLCLGANLARLEICVMFEELLNRFDHFELDGSLARMNNNRLVGMTDLPVKTFLR